jgi:hypothetical protein
MDAMLSVWMPCTDQALWRGQELRSVAAPGFPTELRVGQAIGVGEAMPSSFTRLSGFRLFLTDSLLGFRLRS